MSESGPHEGCFVLVSSPDTSLVQLRTLVEEAGGLPFYKEEMEMGESGQRSLFLSRALVLSGLLGALGVMLGAYSAHGLEKKLQSKGLDPSIVAKRVETMETGVRYHLLHALALVGWVSVSDRMNARILRVGLWAILVGVFVFSGSLYLLVALDYPKLGAVTPIGGVLLIIGWLLAGWAAASGPSTGKITG